MTDDLLTTSEAVEYLGTGRNQVLELFRTGTILAVKTAKGWMVSKAALDELLRSLPARRSREGSPS